jgi:hypothetical protein
VTKKIVLCSGKGYQQQQRDWLSPVKRTVVKEQTMPNRRVKEEPPTIIIIIAGIAPNADNAYLTIILSTSLAHGLNSVE